MHLPVVNLGGMHSVYLEKCEKGVKVTSVGVETEQGLVWLAWTERNASGQTQFIHPTQIITN